MKGNQYRENRLEMIGLGKYCKNEVWIIPTGLPRGVAYAGPEVETSGYKIVRPYGTCFEFSRCFGLRVLVLRFGFGSATFD
ncbi:hypothetical protein, partial [Indibacter alkaliphilus]|uniref:hypothetical protein n=1 Tax=Indibacter alkaliphilus TaxID=579922 RepID=UPI001F1E49BB